MTFLKVSGHVSENYFFPDYYENRIYEYILFIKDYSCFISEN